MSFENDSTLMDEYIIRINKVQDYIDANLSSELSLQLLSEVANFSPYHFHRIFTSIVKEPLFKYIQRLRLEKAAFLLMLNRKKLSEKLRWIAGFQTKPAFPAHFAVILG